MNNDLAQLQIHESPAENGRLSRDGYRNTKIGVYTRGWTMYIIKMKHIECHLGFWRKTCFYARTCSHITYLSHVLTEGNVLRKTSCFCRAIVNGAQMLSVFQLNMQHLRNRNAKTWFCSNVLDLKDAGLRYCLRSPTIETSCVSRVWCVNAWEIPECQHKANWHSSRFQRRGRRCIVFR